LEHPLRNDPVPLRGDVPPSKVQIARILAAFFFTYALFQVPAGWASDRWGARRMLTA
jgi:MFS family permease